MTREEAIQIIKNLPIYRMEQEYDRKSDLMKALKMAVESLGNDTNVGSKWIPCSELPKTNGVYQITRKIQVGDFVHYIVTCAYFDGHNQWHNDNGVNSARKYLKDVIAWCPLLEPYKEGET